MSKSKRFERNNAAVKKSLDTGNPVTVGETEYVGKPPIYVDVSPPTSPVPNWVKAQKGVPFVHARRQLLEETK